jgi:hypothetical protein
LILCQAILTVPKHLEEARELLKTVSAPNNRYQHRPSVVTWGENAVCNTDCSGLGVALLQKAYPWATPDWFKATFAKLKPLAKDFYIAIKKGSAFQPIGKVSDLQPGDWIAIQYEKEADNTGHLMIVNGVVEKIQAAEPQIPDLDQYIVPILDCTSSPHGPKDTRRGTKTGGIGTGEFRLYAKPDGTLNGYAWSISSKAKFYAPGTRDLIVGRLTTP